MGRMSVEAQATEENPRFQILLPTHRIRSSRGSHKLTIFNVKSELLLCRKPAAQEACHLLIPRHGPCKWYRSVASLRRSGLFGREWPLREHTRAVCSVKISWVGHLCMMSQSLCMKSRPLCMVSQSLCMLCRRLCMVSQYLCVMSQRGDLTGSCFPPDSESPLSNSEERDESMQRLKPGDSFISTSLRLTNLRIKRVHNPIIQRAACKTTNFFPYHTRQT